MLPVSGYWGVVNVRNDAEFAPSLSPLAQSWRHYRLSDRLVVSIAPLVSKKKRIEPKTVQSPCSLLPPFFHYFFFQLRQPALFTFALVDIRSTRRWYNTSTLAWNLCHRRHLDLLYLYCSLRCGKQNHYDGWGVTFCGTLKTLLLQNEAVPTFKNPNFNY